MQYLHADYFLFAVAPVHAGSLSASSARFGVVACLFVVVVALRCEIIYTRMRTVDGVDPFIGWFMREWVIGVNTWWSYAIVMFSNSS